MRDYFNPGEKRERKINVILTLSKFMGGIEGNALFSGRIFFLRMFDFFVFVSYVEID